MKHLAAAAAAALLLTIAGCGWWSGLLIRAVSPPSGPAPAYFGSACAFGISDTHLHPPITPMLTTELPDGALIIGSSHRKGSTIVVALTRMNPHCGQIYNLTPIRVQVGRFGTIDTVVATPQGELLVGGSDGKHALVGRFLATGQADSTFGTRGWVRLAPHEKPVSGMPPAAFVATSVAVGPSGTIIVGGNDGGPHCCVRDFVSELTSAGYVERTLVLQDFGGAYTTDVYANGDGSVYALGEYEQSGCGGPSIVRIDRNGLLDKRFDATIKRTVKKIMSVRSLRFTPTLVPDGSRGRFLLVGGLDSTCVANESARLASSGVEVAVKASGKISRRLTRFTSPNYAFDSPVAIRLSSGQVFAAAVAYRADGGVRLLVQGLNPDGSVAGRHVFRAPAKRRATFATVALLPGGHGRVWLIVGVKKEIVASSPFR